MTVVEPMEQIMSDKTETTTIKLERERRRDIQDSHIIYFIKGVGTKDSKDRLRSDDKENLKCNEVYIVRIGPLEP